MLYCPVDPLKGPAELERMQARHEECPVDGWKVYPTNGIIDPATSNVHMALFDDRELAFPFWEKAIELGVPRVAVHKAMPVGPGRLEKDNVHDVSVAAVAFPQIQFEVVHAGWAFLEDSALQMMLHPNVWANLENVANFAVRQPRKFAHVIGTLMQYAGDDRIMFGTGCCAAHPQPILDAFTSFQMPQDLVDGYGFPELTDDSKRKILGGNFARLHGFDPAERAARIAGDEWTAKRAARLAGEPSPWRAHRERHGFAVA
jgi:predicted TIM-barrel fold metal-dependent hydrolase